MIIEIVWALFTLLIVSVAAIVAKKMGPLPIAAMVAASALMANVFAAKIIDFMGLYVTAGTIIYSVSYYLTDLLSEFYGKEAARTAVWTGFLVNVVYLVSLLIVLKWDPAPFWEGSEAFSSTLGMSLRITAASLIFYLIPQLHDTWAYHWLRERTGGRYLWVRNLGSTIVSQFIDTVGFLLIAFWGILEMHQLFIMILSVYLVKILIAGLDTPYLYAVRWYFKRKG